MDEELLEGGNTHDAILRVGGTVRRPTGPWTSGVHALLRHLEKAGFDGAPRVLGVDKTGREVLTFVEGEVVYPGRVDLLAMDSALAEVARLIRSLHDAVAGFDGREYEWSDRGSDGAPDGEIVCHNDLAPWNLVRRPGGGWAFVDWDLAAPGDREWDVAWALLTLVPLMDDDTPSAATMHRLRVFREAYGPAGLGPSVVDLAVARCEREAHLIKSLGTAGERPYARLLAEGHDLIWASAAEHVAGHAEEWKGAFSPSPAPPGSA